MKPAHRSSSTGDTEWGPTAPPLGPEEELAPGYRVVRHVRRGRRLDVYDVWSTERRCRCVAKTLRPERARDGGAVDQLCTEGRLLAAMTHPHLVRAYAIVRTGAPVRPAVVLETLPGETVDHLLERSHRLSVVDTAVLGLQLGSALGYLHTQGWLHLDVKPANVIASGGRAVLLDLSLAARPGTIAPGGTVAYQAPEQLSATDVVTAASDVWGLGVTLFECSTGDVPRRKPVPGRQGSVPRHRALARLLDACLDERPAGRPELTSVVAELAVIAGIDPARDGPVAPARRRRG